MKCQTARILKAILLDWAAGACRGEAFPSTIVDVGAYEGSCTRLAQNIWPANIRIMVEATTGKLGGFRTIGETHRELLGAKHVGTVVLRDHLCSAK
jgi:hypothetical protein